MSVETFYLSRRSETRAGLRELDRVRLSCAVTTDEGDVIEAGRTGTIVGGWREGAAFEVEFAHPVGSPRDGRGRRSSPGRRDSLSGVVWPREFALAPEKITGDLLDPDHPDGGSEAAFFLRFGFDRASPSQLGFALLGHAIPDNVIRETISSRGDVKFVCEGPLATPDGRCARVRTVWQVDAQMRGHFVTAYPIGTAGAA